MFNLSHGEISLAQAGLERKRAGREPARQMTERANGWGKRLALKICGSCVADDDQMRKKQLTCEVVVHLGDDSDPARVWNDGTDAQCK